MGVQIGRMHRSYSGFNEMRRAIAALIGFDLNTMLGWGGSTRWDAFSDPLKPFFMMADCEGSIPPDTAATIAGRLRDVLNDPKKSDYLNEFDQGALKDLIESLEESSRQGKVLHYS